jgi:peptidoglycan/xylan/chitin deacetylase (PgdA/CDA1 family)
MSRSMNRKEGRRGGGTVVGSMVGTAAGLWATNALPAITSAGSLRAALAPTTTGIGRPGGVAFTFDDGPDPASTPRFLDLLSGQGVRATFFMLGFMVRRAPGLAAEIAAAGHEIGVHGDLHRNLLFRDPLSTVVDITAARDLIAETTGSLPRWYRPPYGILTTSAMLAATGLGMRPVLWSCWGRDWTARATPESVRRTVRRRLAGGGTVLLHDADCTSAPQSWRATLGALPALLDDCREHGWQPVTLGEHLTPVRPAVTEHSGLGRPAVGL